MALPVVEKTYEISANNAIPTQGQLAHSQESMFLIKKEFVNFTNNPWVTKGSSDGTASAPVGDDVDRWVTSANLVWSTGNHSWIVLERVDGAQLLLDLDKSSSDQVFAYWSASAGFTGGTISVRPTATDEIEIVTHASGYWNGDTPATPNQHVIHLWHSSDGLISRVAICTGGFFVAHWRFETLKSPRAGHTNNPTIATITGSSSQTAELGLSTYEDNGVIFTEKDGTGTPYLLRSGGLAISGPHYTAASFASVVEEWDSELFCVEEHFVSFDVGARGPKGQSFDNWFGQYQVASTGDTFPNNPAAREFVMLGVLIWPWTGDATIPQVA